NWRQASGSIPYQPSHRSSYGGRGRQRACCRAGPNMVVGDTATWEQSAAFRLEMAARKNAVRCYARNDGLGLTIPYEWYNVDRSYEPDYLVRLLAQHENVPF